MTGDLDYTFEDVSVKPTVNGGFAYATGASSSGRVDEFNNFFPTNHKFYGAADLIGLGNLVDGHVHASIKAPKRPVGIRLGIYNLALTNPSVRRWDGLRSKPRCAHLGNCDAQQWGYLMLAAQTP